MALEKPVRGNASGALRWFAAEFFVVVTGVIVALGATSWWEGQRSQEREAAYLTQLLADLEHTQLLVTRGNEDMSEGDAAAEAIVAQHPGKSSSRAGPETRKTL